jgi:hypothetical protein
LFFADPNVACVELQQPHAPAEQIAHRVFNAAWVINYKRRSDEEAKRRVVAAVQLKERLAAGIVEGQRHIGRKAAQAEHQDQCRITDIRDQSVQDARYGQAAGKNNARRSEQGGGYNGAC